MTRRLVLITNTFPYGQGEEFIEPELPIIADNFDHVHIIATQVVPEAIQTRSLPPNATAFAIRTPGQSTIERLRFMASGLPSVLLNPQSRVRAREGWPRPRAIISSLFFEARAQWISTRAIDAMKSIPWELRDEVTVYSFWLHVAARVGEIIRDTLLMQRPSLRIRFVSRAHNYDLYPHATTLGYLPQRRELLSSLDSVHPISQAGADYLTRHFPQFAHKISVQRLGTREPVPRPTLSRERLYVTSCSFVVPIKRLARIPAIMEGLAQRGIPVTWTHIGGGPELKALRSTVKETNKLAEVKLIGYVDHAKLFEAYAEHPSTLLLNLSESEGLPVSMMEAISGGIPVVATDVGGVAEIVRPGVSGWLLSEDFTDMQAMEAVQKVWELTDGEYDRLCATARRLWEEEFRAADTYHRFGELLIS